MERYRMKARIENGNLIIEIPISDPPVVSASGKSLIVASTSGNRETSVEIQGKKVIIGLNAYIKRD